MRVMLFFDLPMVTKEEVRTYTRFKKALTKEGYVMMQFSVYYKVLNNREAALKHVNKLEKIVPKEGQVRVMIITEKQYANMFIIAGEKSVTETTIGVESFIEL